MNYFWARSLYNYFESFLLFKVIYVTRFKLSMLSLLVNLPGKFMYDYCTLWKNIFYPKFWLNRKTPNFFRHENNPHFITFIKTKAFFIFTNFFKKNFLIYFFFNRTNSVFSSLLIDTLRINFRFTFFWAKCLDIYKRTCGDGFMYIRGLIIIFFIDASFTDDEPLWEPIEWSLVQTWLMFIFMFAWIAENLVTSRYGSYTGRDKRVWFGWYKSFWLIEFWYFLSFATASAFVIVPFYWELTYSISLVFSWWNWYTKLFFFKFVSLYSIVLLLSFILQINIRWLNWKKLMLFVLIINFFIAYLLYTHFIMSFFGYFTDPLWYQKTRFIDYIQLSHEPLKWGWGPAKRDHFTYHRSSTVFWFKNDGPFAGSFLMMHLFFFVTIFFIYIYWLVLLRRIYTTKEITYNFTTFCVSALKQFFFFFLLLYLFVFFSFIINYWRFPIEFLWLVDSSSWFLNFLNIMSDYVFFLLNIF